MKLKRILFLAALAIALGGKSALCQETSTTTTTTTTTTHDLDDEGCGGEEVQFQFFEQKPIAHLSSCQQLNRWECLNLEEARHRCPCVCKRRSRYYHPKGLFRNRKPPEPVEYEFVDIPEEKGLGSVAAVGGYCFSAGSSVITNRGEMTMEQLFFHQQHLGEVSLLSYSPDNGVVAFSPLRYWIHAEPNVTTEFRRIATSSGRLIELTPRHLIYRAAEHDGSRTEAVFAAKIRPGDRVFVGGRTRVYLDTVTRVGRRRANGIYAPLTESGSLMVDGVAASCYVNEEHERLQHFTYRMLLNVERWLQAGFLTPRRDDHEKKTVSNVLLAFDRLRSFVVNTD